MKYMEYKIPIYHNIITFLAMFMAYSIFLGIFTELTVILLGSLVVVVSVVIVWIIERGEALVFATLLLTITDMVIFVILAEQLYKGNMNSLDIILINLILSVLIWLFVRDFSRDYKKGM